MNVSKKTARLCGKICMALSTKHWILCKPLVFLNHLTLNLCSPLPPSASKNYHSGVIELLLILLISAISYCLSFFLSLKFFTFYLHVYMCVCVIVCYMCVDAKGGPKKVLDPLELDLQVVMSHLKWVLGTKLRSFERDASTLNYWATSQLFVAGLFYLPCSVFICVLVCEIILYCMDYNLSIFSSVSGHLGSTTFQLSGIILVRIWAYRYL